MTSNHSNRMNRLKKRGLCLAGLCSILLSLAATGCDVLSASTGAAVVGKAAERSLPIRPMCPPNFWDVPANNIPT